MALVLIALLIILLNTMMLGKIEGKSRMGAAEDEMVIASLTQWT